MSSPLPCDVHVARPIGSDEEKKRRGEVAKRGRAPLYVYRKVVNGEAIAAWCREQGFPTVRDPSTMHVTITYSKDPVDWLAMGEPDNWPNPDANGNITLSAGGPRMLESFGGGDNPKVIVLAFASNTLAWRHRSMREKGASWKFPDYTPHITLSADAGEFDFESLKPYTGEIVLGPEIFEPIDEEWAKKIVEKGYNPNQPRDPGGEGGGQWISGGGGGKDTDGDTAKEQQDRFEDLDVLTEPFDELNADGFPSKYYQSYGEAKREWAKLISRTEARGYALASGDREVSITNEQPEATLVSRGGKGRNDARYKLTRTAHGYEASLTFTFGDYAQTKKVVEKREGDFGDIRKANIDGEHGLVFGFAIVSKVNGEDFYDSQLDPITKEYAGDHIPEEAMVDAALDFAKSARLAKQMHEGEADGMVPFLMPITKAVRDYIVENDFTGLFIGMHPAPDALAKFKSGDYRGFSIGGNRIVDEEVKD